MENVDMDEDEKKDLLEMEAREAFRDTYSEEYLAHLSKRDSKTDLVELLWAGFVNGYCYKNNN
jgi:hypothetical protein